MSALPVSDCEVRDPRIRRTRQLLQGALDTLLRSRNFDEISVNDITEVATVNRATFYDHYADKFALLDALVAGGFHKLLHERDVRFDGSCPSMASAVIRAACDYLLMMHQGHTECSGQSAFEPLIDAAITGAIRRVLTGNARAAAEADSLPFAMAATAASWAINGAIKEWYRTPNRPSVDEIVPEILALVVPILQPQSKAATSPELAVR